MTGSRPCCGARSPRRPTAPNMPAPRSTWSRSPRCARRARRQVARGREKLPSILGTPAPGEVANGETFDGETEVATFPGDLPADPEELFKGGVSRPLQHALPNRPISASCASGRRCWNATADDEPALPHIRLDRALQFLIGDRLQ